MKMKKVLAAVFALTAAAANFGTAAFAEEAVVVTEEEAVISEEVVFTEPVIVEEAAEETTVTEETAEETTETTAATEVTETTETTETTEVTKLPEVTEQMLLDKFTAEYGDPVSANYGDFNGDGQLDAHMSIFEEGRIVIYFVTNDSITFVKETDTAIGGSSEDYLYFTLDDGTKFVATLYHRGSAGYVTAGLGIDKIESDGSLTAVSINGESTVSVLTDDFIGDDGGIDPSYMEYTADLTDEQLFTPGTYLSSNGSTITINHYIYDSVKDIGSNTYSYDKEKNAFVPYSAGAGTAGSNGGSTAVSNSPETGDSMDIPAVMAATLIVGTAVAVSIKKKRR